MNSSTENHLILVIFAFSKWNGFSFTSGVSVNILRNVATTKSQLAPTLPSVIPYLDVTSNQEYLIKRLQGQIFAMIFYFFSLPLLFLPGFSFSRRYLTFLSPIRTSALSVPLFFQHFDVVSKDDYFHRKLPICFYSHLIAMTNLFLIFHLDLPRISYRWLFTLVQVELRRHV